MPRVKRPTSTTVISVLYFIGAGLAFIFAILFPLGIGGLALAGISITTGFIVLFVLLFLIIAALNLVVGIGLWKLRNWARILALVLASLSGLFSLISLFTGDISSIAGLVVAGLYIYFLGFHKPVLDAFYKANKK